MRFVRCNLFSTAISCKKHKIRAKSILLTQSSRRDAQVQLLDKKRNKDILRGVRDDTEILKRLSESESENETLVNMSRTSTSLCQNCGSRACTPFARSAPSSTTKPVHSHSVKESAVDILSSLRSRTTGKIGRMRAKSDPADIVPIELGDSSIGKLDQSKVSSNAGTSNLSAGLQELSHWEKDRLPNQSRQDDALSTTTRYKRRSRGSSLSTTSGSATSQSLGSSWSSGRPDIASLASIDDEQSSADDMPVRRKTTPSRRTARSPLRLLKGRNARTFDERTSPIPPNMEQAWQTTHANSQPRYSDHSLHPDSAGALSTSVPPTIQFSFHHSTSTPAHEARSFWQPAIYPAEPAESPISVLALRSHFASSSAAATDATSRPIAIPARPATSAFLPLQ